MVGLDVVEGVEDGEGEDDWVRFGASKFRRAEMKVRG